jgi:hypothetical protein
LKAFAAAVLVRHREGPPKCIVAKVVLVSQLTELPQLVQTQARVLLLPEIEALLTDAMLAADLHYGRACFGFPQQPQNLFLCVPSLTHPGLLLVSSRQPRRPETLNFKTEEFLGNGMIRRLNSVPSREIVDGKKEGVFDAN